MIFVEWVLMIVDVFCDVCVKMCVWVVVIVVFVFASSAAAGVRAFESGVGGVFLV